MEGAGGKEAGMKQNQGAPEKAPLQLSEEEKAVLMECRRNSTARGLAVAAGSLVLLRAVIGSGRVPLHVQRWSSLYYTAVGAVGFLAGLRSYRGACLDKIMALEHSVLADQLRQHRRKQLQGWSDEEHLPSLPSVSPLTSPPPPPPIQPNTVTRVPGGGNDVEQPDAFGPAALSTPPPHTSGDYDNSPSNFRGRTFDEIRDENRRRQQQRHYPQSRVGGVPGEDAGSKHIHVRRNKYGDTVSEE